MSILIKGMQMPETCAECPCMRHDSVDFLHAYQCNLTLERIENPDYILSRKEAKCPLEEAEERTGKWIKDIEKWLDPDIDDELALERIRKIVYGADIT